jgi:hypothetical protein
MTPALTGLGEWKRMKKVSTFWTPSSVSAFSVAMISLTLPDHRLAPSQRPDEVPDQHVPYETRLNLGEELVEAVGGEVVEEGHAPVARVRLEELRLPAPDRRYYEEAERLGPLGVGTEEGELDAVPDRQQA